MALDLTSEEKEILALKATWEAVNTMVNYEVLSLSHKDPESEIRFNTPTHAKYFNIMLLDFLHSRIFGLNKNCMQSLQDVLRTSAFNEDISSLTDVVGAFNDWLEAGIELEHDGEARAFWFPSVEQDIRLQIKRVEFIKICGNISKHNILGLDRQAKTMGRILKRNEVDIELTQALLIMEEFYEQFHRNILMYHSSVIAEFWNNLLWAIYEYLRPLYMQSVEWYWDEPHRLRAYRYDFPDKITNSYVRQIFWGLMNDVRSEPYMPRFAVTRYLKMRY
jgi:hypothetical protein